MSFIRFLLGLCCVVAVTHGSFHDSAAQVKVTGQWKAKGNATFTSAIQGSAEKESFDGALKGAEEWLVLEPDKSKRQAAFVMKPKKLLPPGTLSRKEDPTGNQVKVLLRETTDTEWMNAIIPQEGEYFFVCASKPKVSERGRMQMEMQPIVWCEGALHVFDSPVSFAGFKFNPEKGHQLCFQVDLQRGYVFVDGKGAVERLNDSVFIDSDGTVHELGKGVVVLDSARKGFVLVGTGL